MISPTSITLCMGSSCFSRGNGKNLPRIQEFLKDHGLAAQVAGDPDHVLTAEELGALLVATGIDVDSCAPAAAVREGSRAGLRFAVSGGVAAAVTGRFDPGVAPKPYVINGLSPKMIRLLAAFAKTGKAPGQLVEVMCCEGG